MREGVERGHISSILRLSEPPFVKIASQTHSWPRPNFNILSHIRAISLSFFFHFSSIHFLLIFFLSFFPHFSSFYFFPIFLPTISFLFAFICCSTSSLNFRLLKSSSCPFDSSEDEESDSKFDVPADGSSCLRELIMEDIVRLGAGFAIYSRHKKLFKNYFFCKASFY